MLAILERVEVFWLRRCLACSVPSLYLSGLESADQERAVQLRQAVGVNVRPILSVLGTAF